MLQPLAIELDLARWALAAALAAAIPLCTLPAIGRRAPRR